MHFLHPEWGIMMILAGLILIGYLVLFYFRIRVLRKIQIDRSMLVPRDRNLEIIKVLLLFSSTLFAVIALMQPVGGAHYLLGESTATQDVIFALDASASMEIPDTRTGVSRFNLAREMIGDASQDLKGNQVSLVSFTENVVPLVPETFDHFFLQLFLTQVVINEGGIPGTNLEGILQWLKGKEGRGILFTDGGDTEYIANPNERKKQLLKMAEELEYPLIVVGIGGETPKPIPGFNAESKMEKSLLEAIAEASGGSFLTPSDRVTGEIVEVIQRQLLIPKQMKEKEVVVYDEYFYYPLGLSLLCLVLFLILPDTRRRG